MVCLFVCLLERGSSDVDTRKWIGEGETSVRQKKKKIFLSPGDAMEWRGGRGGVRIWKEDERNAEAGCC